MAIRVLVLAMSILCAGRGVRAGDADDLIRQGVEHRRQGDDPGALLLFERANEMARSPRALAQMGLAEQALGRWVVASEHLKEALAASGDPWIVKNRSILNDAATRVGDHVGRLEILGGTAGAEVRLDGIPRGTLPLPGPLTTTTGTLAIDLVMAGRLPLRRTTSVRPGETTRESFDALLVESSGVSVPGEGGGRGNATQAKKTADLGRPVPPVSAAAADHAENQSSSLGPSPVTDVASAAEAHGSSARLPLMIGTGALAAGALIFGVLEHVSWQDKVTSFNEMASCDPNANDYGGAGCAGLHEDALHARNLAFVGYGLAGILAATSAILFLAWDHDAPAQPRVACSGSPGLHGLDCVLRF